MIDQSQQTKAPKVKNMLFLSENTTVESEVSSKEEKETQQSIPAKHTFFHFAKLNLQSCQTSSKYIAKIYLLSHVIGKIQSNNCFSHSYLIFYIPAILTIAEHLSMYIAQKHLQSYNLFTFLLKRVSFVQKLTPKQLNDEEVVNYLTIAIRYKTNPEQIVSALKEFLQKYELRMKGFMPVYYLYFLMIADKQQLLPPNSGVKEAIQLVKSVESQFKKYHNDNI